MNPLLTIRQSRGATLAEMSMSMGTPASTIAGVERGNYEDLPTSYRQGLKKIGFSDEQVEAARKAYANWRAHEQKRLLDIAKRQAETQTSVAF